MKKFWRPMLVSQAFSAQAVMFWLAAALTVTMPIFPRQPSHGLAFLSVLVASSWVVAHWGKWKEHATVIDLGLLAMLFSAALSTWFARLPWHVPWHGVNEALLSWATYTIVTRSQTSRPGWRIIGDVAVLATALAACVALYRYYANGIQIELSGVRGTIRSSLYVAICLFLALGYAVLATGRRRLLGLIVCAILFPFLLMLTSRAVIGLTVLLLGWMLFCLYRRRALAALLAVVALAAIAWEIQPETYQEKFLAKARELYSLAAHGKISDNDRYRIAIWTMTVSSIGEQGRPMWLGVGPRQFHLFAAKESERQTYVMPYAEQSISHAHNIFLTRYIEYGVVGVLTMLFFFASWFSVLWQRRDERQRNPYWWGALAGLALPFLAGQVGSPWAYEYSWLAVLMLALLIRSSEHSPREPLPSGSISAGRRGNDIAR